MLNFFATWCGPCKAEMPELGRFEAQRRGQPFLIIGVDAEEKPDLVRAFVRDLPVPFPVGIDASGELQKSFGVESYPTTILIGFDGRVQIYQPGAIMNADVALAAVTDTNLEQLRRGRGVAKVAYLDALKTERFPTPPPSRTEGPALSGRAQQIASGMDCPCGCSDTLKKCSCNTARKVKARLASLPLDGRTGRRRHAGAEPRVLHEGHGLIRAEAVLGPLLARPVPRRGAGARRARPGDPGRRLLRAARPERCGQEHGDVLPARPAAPDQGHGQPARRAAGARQRHLSLRLLPARGAALSRLPHGGRSGLVLRRALRSARFRGSCSTKRSSGCACRSTARSRCASARRA